MSARPVLFFLHGLGLDGNAAQPLRRELDGEIDVIGIDLPGFGAQRDAVALDVEAVVAHVEQEIGKHGATEWGLIGHSMGGKIAQIVAARALGGASSLFGLRGVVLLAASPLSVEPMDEQRRNDMLAWADGEAIAVEDAETFVGANTTDGVAADVRAAAIEQVRRSAPAAWRSWLLRGSREDWSGIAEHLDCPALVVAGAEDGEDLGIAAQVQVNLPRFPRGWLHEIDGAAHFIMLEQPARLATLVREFWAAASRGPAVPERTARLIGSPRTSARTRAILAARALADDPAYTPAAMSNAQLRTLRALAGHLVPQPDDPIDLAARVDAQLAAGAGDGWRHASLPPDRDAYAAGLDELRLWGELTAPARAARLEGILAGDRLGGSLSDEQFTAWLEDVRVDLVRQWLAHPATMDRIDFDGFANGGDGARLQGFTQLGAGRSEPRDRHGQGGR